MASSKESSMKRQKEVSRKKKQENKLQRKIAKKLLSPSTFEEMLEQGSQLQSFDETDT